jgi:probable DNA repair protein
VWFLGSGDLDWPIAASGNPLLPWQLQRDLGMPGTEVARDSEDARQTTARIAASASAAVFSYAVESTGGMQQPSPALKGLHLEEADAARLAGAELERSIVALEAVEDSDPVQTLPDRVIRGGSQILKLQAACGFRAFAEQRLWSTEIDPEELGMDVRQSGTAVHRVLELFWKEVKTQQALKAMPRAERESLLGHCIAQSLEKIAALNETPWDAAYIQMQRDRLHRLIGPWLELEMRRQPFEVKLSEKDFNDVPVGPLRLRVRVDRVDLVEGGEVLIDYKTGAASTNAWLSQRPDEPQLPLYATLAGPEQLQGVAFGLVRAGDNLDLTGYGASKGILPHQRKLEASSLEEQVDSWRHVLVNLATAFHEADATVAPKKYPTTCERCAQRILCRLDVSRLEENDTAETLHG